MPTKPLSLLLTVLWTGLVAVAMLAPEGLPDADFDWAWAGWFIEHGGDKLAHLVLFFGQAFWLSKVLADRGASGASRWWPAALAAVYGLVLETAQLAVPGRGFELADLAANILGSCLWPLLSLLFSRR